MRYFYAHIRFACEAYEDNNVRAGCLLEDCLACKYAPCFGAVLKKELLPNLGITHGCSATFDRQTTGYVFVCLLLALLPQLLGIGLFVDLPDTAGLIDFSMYTLGAATGVGAAMMALYILPRISRSVGVASREIYCRLSEKQLLLLTFICFLPVLPDSILAFIMSQQNVNVRALLLTDSSIRILDPKLIMLFSRAVIVLIWFHLIFVRPKKTWVTSCMLLLYLMETFIWASRSEFVALGMFYIANSSQLLNRRNIIYGITGIMFLGLYTILIQGRGDLEILMQAIFYYTTYFAYPAYLSSMIPSVFHDVTIPYALFGYPVDVIETYQAGSGMIARHLDEIATNSSIGLDILGYSHDEANVLYPHYGFLGLTLGHLGVFLYYAILIFIFCILAEKFRRYRFAWRIFLFIFVLQSSSSFALGLPGSWFTIIYAFLFCFLFMRARTAGMSLPNINKINDFK